MNPAAAVPATYIVDRNTTSADLTEFAHYERQLAGTFPFVRALRIEASCAAASLLPAGATIERCVTTDNSVHLLASADDASIFIEAWARTTTARVAARCHAHAEMLALEIRSRAPEPPEGTVPVRVWHHNHDRPATSADRTIAAPLWDGIARNYSSATRAALQHLVALRRPVATGKLVLWHGPPGTGKTTALRALMRTWEPWCQAQYIADPERFFGEPAYMTQVLATAPVARVGPSLHRPGQPEAVWRLLIAEDSDEYLRASARRDAGAALGRLLNLADGILGQGMNVLVLLTTNEETARLHPALVRPGRCLAAIEFPPLDTAEASAWLGTTVSTPATLAELLARRGDLSQVGPTAATATRTGQYL